MKKVILVIMAIVASCLFLSACLGNTEIGKLQSYARLVKEAVSVKTETVISNDGYTLNIRRIEYFIETDGVTVTEEVTMLSESLEDGDSYNTTVDNYTIEREELFSLFPLNIDCKIDTRYFENGSYTFKRSVLAYTVKPALTQEFLNGAEHAENLSVKVVFESTAVKSFIMNYVLPSGNSVKTKFSYEYALSQ